MIANDPYAELERRFGRMSAVNRAGAILNWDRSTMMPDGASGDRADQLATLGVIAHEIISAPEISSTTVANVRHSMYGTSAASRPSRIPQPSICGSTCSRRNGRPIAPT